MSCKKLFFSSIIICVLLSFPIICSVEASSQMWSRTYGGVDQEVAQSLVETSDGGYALAGYIRSFRAYDDFSDEIWLVKTDSYGKMEWNKTYGVSDFVEANSLIETSDGGYAIAGSTASFGAGSSDFWLVKLDSYGDVEWNQTYGGTEGDSAYSLVQTSDGGYALTGSTYSFGAGEDDVWLVKIDRYGNLEWNRTYGGTGSESASSLIVTSDGGYAIAGDISSIYSPSIYSSDYDFWLIKTDANGNMEWNQTYNTDDLDYASSLVETSDGGYAIVGVFSPGPFPIGGSWLVKTDANGYMQWSQTYDIGLDSLVVTSDGGYALGGSITSYPPPAGIGNYDVWLVKTDVHGNMEWNQTYGGLDDDVANSLVETSDGGYALAGYTGSFESGDCDFLLLKTDEYGIIPEFPSWTILLLFMVVSLIAILIRKRTSVTK